MYVMAKNNGFDRNIDMHVNQHKQGRDSSQYQIAQVFFSFSTTLIIITSNVLTFAEIISSDVQKFQSQWWLIPLTNVI